MKHNKPDDWQLFLSVLMGSDANLNVSIDEAKDEVSVTAEDEQSQKKLEHFMQKPWLAKRNLAVQIRREEEAQLSKAPVLLDKGVPTPEKTPQTTDEGIAFLQQLFRYHDKKVFWNIAEGNPYEESTTLLWEIDVEDEELREMNDKRMAYLRKLLHNATLQEAYLAAHSKTSKTLPKPPTVLPTTAENIYDKCIGTMTDASGKTFFLLTTLN